MKHKASTLHRRKFLKMASAASALIGFPTIIPARVLGADAPSNRIQIAQIGCGRIARDMDIPGVLKHPNLARIIAVSDLDLERAELARQQVEAGYEKSIGQKVYVSVHQDYHELLARQDIDAVMICTPDHWHAQPVVETALAGKDIYVQKPLSFTIAEGRLMSDVVRAKDRVFQIGTQQRSIAQFHRICELVRNGGIGRLKSVEVGLPTDPSGGNGAAMPIPVKFDYDSWLGGAPEAPYSEERVHPQTKDPKKRFGRPGWLRLSPYTCGMITGWGAHHVDIALWGMGAEYTGPISVEARADWPGKESFWDVHGKFKVQMTYPENISMAIGDEFTVGIRFVGEEGWILVKRGTPKDGIETNDPRLLDQSDAAWKTRLHRSANWDHHLDWLEAMRNRKPAATNAEIAHRSCSACLVGWIGMKLGRPLKWDPVKEQFNDLEANRMLHRAEREPFGAFHAAHKAGFTNFKSLRSEA